MDDKNRMDDLDEDFFINSIKKQPTTIEKVSDSKSVEPTKKRRQSAIDYQAIYLTRHKINVRQNVYISRDVHQKISKIVSTISDREISVGGYIDTVLSEHLETHKDEINKLYRQERDDLV